MNLIQQPNNWTCCATSYAMLMNLPYVEMAFNIAGHDGSEIVFPDLKEPACRRGHSPFEFLQHALHSGFALTCIPIKSMLVHETRSISNRLITEIDDTSITAGACSYETNMFIYERDLWTREKSMALFRQFREKYDMLLLGTSKGTGHHAAWCKERKVVYDPMQRITNEPEFQLHTLWAKIPIKEQ